MEEFYKQRELDFQNWFSNYGELYTKLEEDELRRIFEWGFTSGCQHQLNENTKQRESN